MTLSLVLYRWLLRLVVEILDMFPPKRVEKLEVEMRKGCFQPEILPQQGVIWVHGASLGEIITLRPFLSELAGIVGRNRLLCSATTMDGYRRLLQDGLCEYATLLPIELPEILDPFIERFKPKLVIISETEIWPLFFHILSKKNIPFGIVNARMNKTSLRLMKLCSGLFKNAVDKISFVFPQNRLYAKRFKMLGIPKDAISIMGCFKYDFIDPPRNIDKLRIEYGIPPGRSAICFGSTHEGEEEMILQALEPLWKDIQSTIILAPRHIERIPEIENLLRSRHLNYSTLNQKLRPAAHILLVDKLGELRNMYAICSLAFVGGSLVPHGGHNLMEPAAFGVPIITGPFTKNFPSETDSLQSANALLTVSDSDSLGKLLKEFIVDPRAFAEFGQRSEEVLNRLAGASRATMHRLCKLGLISDGC